MTDVPELYTKLAKYWQLISPTADYVDEGEFFTKLFQKAGVKTILELGAGGGNVAWFLKKHFVMTLTDLSSEMLEESKKQNPECEHIVGDMRTLDLGRKFDGIFIHDAIMYITSAEDLRAAIQNAARHCKPDGTLIIAPDCTAETIKHGVERETHEAGGVKVSYTHDTTDPDPTDTIFNYDFDIDVWENSQHTHYMDHQLCGIFPKSTWLRLLDEAGFDAEAVMDNSTAGEVTERLEVFVGKRR